MSHYITPSFPAVFKGKFDIQRAEFSLVLSMLIFHTNKQVNTENKTAYTCDPHTKMWLWKVFQRVYLYQAHCHPLASTPNTVPSPNNSDRFKLFLKTSFNYLGKLDNWSCSHMLLIKMKGFVLSNVDISYCNLYLSLPHSTIMEIQNVIFLLVATYLNNWRDLQRKNRFYKTKPQLF